MNDKKLKRLTEEVIDKKVNRLIWTAIIVFFLFWAAPVLGPLAIGLLVLAASLAVVALVIKLTLVLPVRWARRNWTWGCTIAVLSATLFWLSLYAISP